MVNTEMIATDDVKDDIKQVEIESVPPQSLRPHPRNVKIYGSENVDGLKQQILKTLWIKPLVVTQNNVIISGHRRWQAACELKFLSVPVERRVFKDEIAELEFLLLENESRDKTTTQKGREAEEWEYIYKLRAEEKQRAQGVLGSEGGRGNKKDKQTLVELVPQGFPEDKPSTKKEPPTKPNNKKKREPATRDLVAQQAGLGSGKNYENVKKALNAIDTLTSKGNIEEAQALQQVLDKSAKDAASVATMPEETQVAVLSMIVNGEAKNVKSAKLEIIKAENEAQAQAAPTKPQITLASWETWLPQQGLCDLLITDPPYSTDVDDIDAFANAWLPLALSKVKSTGRAYVCIGAYPKELQAYLNVKACLPVQQVLVWSYRNTIGPSPKYDYKLNWQAILYFRGPDAPDLNCESLNEQFSVQHEPDSAQEINAPDGRQGNRYHAWQKPIELAEQLVRHSTKPGDVVMDCFAGTGTFVLAAHRLGRVAYGCDRSAEMLEHAKLRGCEVVSEVVNA